MEEGKKDSWYKKMGDRIPKGPEDEPFVGLTEWVDIMVEKRKNMKDTVSWHEPNCECTECKAKEDCCGGNCHCE